MACVSTSSIEESGADADMVIVFAAVAAAFPRAAHVRDCAHAAAYNADRSGVSFIAMQDGAALYEDYPNVGSAAPPRLRGRTCICAPPG